MAKDIGQEMLLFRGSHNPRLSRATFARMCGISPQTVYNIETGRCKPSMAVEASIRKVMDGGDDEDFLSGKLMDDDYWGELLKWRK